MPDELHVIFGTGPVGCWIARALRDQGRRARAVNRSGERPELMPAEVEVVRADASRPAEALAAAKGASVVYQALNPPYTRWQELFPPLQAAVLGAAKAERATFVSIENLYMFDPAPPITEASRTVPPSRKGALRRRMAEAVMVAHARGEVRATALRSSDYYGPGVTSSALGEMVFGRLVAGKPAQLIGSASLPHSFAYIEDVGRAAVALGTSEAALGRAWIAPHAPAQSQGAMVAEACRVLGTLPRSSVISPLMMRLAAPFMPTARESVEMLYEFTAPFVVDASRIEQAFGLAATPIATGIERTVAWYRQRDAGEPGRHRTSPA